MGTTDMDEAIYRRGGEGRMQNAGCKGCRDEVRDEIGSSDQCNEEREEWRKEASGRSEQEKGHRWRRSVHVSRDVVAVCAHLSVQCCHSCSLFLSGRVMATVIFAPPLPPQGGNATLTQSSSALLSSPLSLLLLCLLLCSLPSFCFALAGPQHQLFHIPPFLLHDNTNNHLPAHHSPGRASQQPVAATCRSNLSQQGCSLCATRLDSTTCGSSSEPFCSPVLPPLPYPHSSFKVFHVHCHRTFSRQIRWHQARLHMRDAFFFYPLVRHSIDLIFHPRGLPAMNGTTSPCSPSIPSPPYLYPLGAFQDSRSSVTLPTHFSSPFCTP